MNGACNGKNIFGPAPWAGKVKYHLISITKSISKVLYQTLCLFSQMKDTKHIRRDFNSVAWVMPQGSDFGRWGCRRVIFFQTWSCGISNRRGWQAEQNASKCFILGSNWWPWGEVKRSNNIKFWITYPFQRFLYQTLCVCSHKWKIQNISDRIFSVTFVMPQGWDFGALGVPWGPFFQIWSCGISNRRGWRAEHNAGTKIHSRVKLVTLGWGQRVKYYQTSVTMTILFFYTKLCVCSLDKR